MEAREFDVVIWGATGFTGQLVVDYMFSQYGIGGEVAWAIAGRNREKLDQVAMDAAGNQADQIPRIVADTTDVDAINDMVQSTRVVCTTVGPYALYGTVLVEACATHGTHCCDLTGEVQWMARTIEQYQTLAESSGAKIVHTCGFDSIPSDMGVFYLQQQMQALHGSVASEVKYRVADTAGGISGGTVASLMNVMEEARVNPQINEVMADPYSLNPLNMPRGEDGPDQSAALYDLDFMQWTAPFVMAAINTRVVRRTNALTNYSYGRDFRYSEAMLMGNGPGGYLKATTVAGVSGLVMLTAAFGPARSLLKQVVPKPGEGPSPEAIANGFFNIELYGRHPDDKEKNLKIRVTGDRDPGYGATSKMLAESAVCLAKDELGEKGGILTPASAMGDKLLQRLQNNAGMTFSVL
ncbi:MAG: short subunit dehydrogenase-like uncharacterized protein [Candidatus Azotimanducaceae bacterium]|jgi:short subunit dehydrogenase-like uncharacterized protein